MTDSSVLRNSLIVGCAVGVLALTGCGSQHPAAHRAAAAGETYGSLPSYLPTTTDVPDSVLTGSVDRPALTTEGDSVDVRLATATVRATVAGPVVPGEGLPEQTASTTCTWTITLSRATSAVAIRVADFTALDHLGAVYPTHLAPGSRSLLARLTPGATVSFELRATMPTGEGLMRWSPGGRRTVASWDFEVEND